MHPNTCQCVTAAYIRFRLHVAVAAAAAAGLPEPNQEHARLTPGWIEHESGTVVLRCSSSGKTRETYDNILNWFVDSVVQFFPFSYK